MLAEVSEDREHPAPPRGATSALARRSPEGLRRSPTFYATGGSVETWRAFMTLVGGPGLLALVFGTLVSLTVAADPGLIMLAVFFAFPMGVIGTNYWFQRREQHALARAQARAEVEGGKSWPALEAPEVLLEVAAHRAIRELEAGNVQAAVDALSIRERDMHRQRRRRNWTHGLRGELLRSVLAWLSPSHFAEEGVARASAFPERGADDQGLALLAALRVLEAASEASDEVLEHTWAAAQASALKAELPMLYTVTLAVTAERLHAHAEELRERVLSDASGRMRGLLERLFPSMRIWVEGGYREASPEAPAVVTQALALVPPPSLVALAEPTPETGELSSNQFMVASGSAALATGLAVGGVMGLASGGLAGLGLGLYFGGMFGLYGGVPVAAMITVSRTRTRQRRRRVEPLTRLEPRPPAAWISECALGPPGKLMWASGQRRFEPVPPGQMVLYVAAARAEQALARAEVEEAWAELRWWFDAFDGRVARPDELHATGSTLVRVAVLSRHQAHARALLAVLPEFSSEQDTSGNRTAYGNAPRAVAMAAVLVASLDEAWFEVPKLLARAWAARPVYMEPRDHALMHACAERARAAGVEEARWGGPAASSEARAWAEGAWPG